VPSPRKPGPGAAQPKPKVRKILDTTKVGIFAIAEGAFVLGTPPGAPGRGKKTKSPRGEIVSPTLKIPILTFDEVGKPAIVDLFGRANVWNSYPAFVFFCDDNHVWGSCCCKSDHEWVRA